MTNVLILAANGQISRLLLDKLLSDSRFDDFHLTLFLRHKARLADYSSPRVDLVEGDLTDSEALNTAMHNQDIVFVGVVDHSQGNVITRNVIKAMKSNGVSRIIFSNVLGIYQEVPGEFGRWNQEMIQSGLPTAIASDRLLANSSLHYTTLRLPWLNDRDQVKYRVTHKNETYLGVSVSRQSVADLVAEIIADPRLYANDSIGLADPATEGSSRPVY